MSSSSSPRSIAVFGYGTVGKPLVHDLLTCGAYVLVLSRDPSKLELPPNANVSSATISYSDEASITAVFKAHRIDIVVSTIGSSFGENQLTMARAAKAAGTVKLFVPSEFGIPTKGHTEGIYFALKDQTAHIIEKEIGIPTVRIYTGLFIEFLPWFSTTPKHPGKFVLAANCKGETKLTWTALSDITAYVAFILTQLPYERIGNTIQRLEGQGASFRDVAQIIGKEVMVVPADDLEEPPRIELHANSDKGWMRTGFDASEPTATKEEIDRKSGSGNVLWEAHVWKTIKDVWPNGVD